MQRFNPVEALNEKPDGGWIVHSKEGDIHCEKLVNAGGYRCNEIGAMMGVELPVVSMEHQYLLTDPIPAIEALDFRVPLIRCPTDDFYCRQEKQGLLVGYYEQDCRTWGLEGIAPDFTMALLPDDLDRLMGLMERSFQRLPCLAEVGVHTVINGPITYTPDGLPLVGPIAGKRNAYCITGLRAGLGEGGGHGWLLAQIIARGEAEVDTWCLDPRRFTRYANVEYTALKAIEDYRNEFRFHMPHEHRPAGRPAKTTPLTERLKELGADFSTVNGWERATYCKPDPDFQEAHSFHFNNCFDLVAAEVAALSEGVGIMEVSGFNRMEITGPGALSWLEGVLCSRLPRRAGKVRLVYFLNHQGNLKGEATLALLPDGRLWYGSAAAAEVHDRDWLAALLPSDGSVRIESLTNSHTTLVIAGPRSRDLLARVSPRVDWSKEAFPWLSVRRAFIGSAEAVVMSVSFSGELAYELHLPNEQLSLAFDILWKAGQDLGMVPFGLYATESMRIEKGYRHWKADLLTEFNPMESGLARFVSMEKDFIGKAALESMIAAGPRRLFVTLEVGTTEAPAQSGDSIMRHGAVVGTVTSAAWGHRVGKNLALGFLEPELASPGTALEVLLLGREVPAVVLEACPYDPQNERLRS